MELIINLLWMFQENNEDTHTLDAQLVEQVVSQAIQNWWEVSQI